MRSEEWSGLKNNPTKVKQVLVRYGYDFSENSRWEQNGNWRNDAPQLNCLMLLVVSTNCQANANQSRIIAIEKHHPLSICIFLVTYYCIVNKYIHIFIENNRLDVVKLKNNKFYWIKFLLTFSIAKTFRIF